MTRLLLTLAIACTLTSVAKAKSPNIVLIMADDMGYGDLGCYGHPVAKTPSIDSLARQGVRFTQHYSNGPECSPTRTALLTGRYQQRTVGLECAIGTGNVGRYDDAIQRAENRDLGLSPPLAVIPKLMKASGYRCGVFGKWHLGYEPKFNPLEFGWDEFFGYLGGNVHYFNHRETSELHVLFRGRMPVHRDGYMTHLITDDSIDFMKRSVLKHQPFFLFVSHECPHFPFQGPQDQNKLVTAENWMEHDQAAYVKMLEDLDSEVGRILHSIDALSIQNDTVVVFVSDNGGFQGAAHMGKLRGAKGTTLEGGIRVPLIIRWPKQIPANVESDQVCITFDLTKSFLNLANTSDAVELDGIDIIHHVREQHPNIDRTLFWRGKRGDRTWKAVRHGDVKLVSKTEAGKSQQWCFDVKADMHESQDIQHTVPQKMRELRSMLDRWEQEMDGS